MNSYHSILHPKTQAKTPKKRHIVNSDSELSLENEPLTTLTDDWPRFIILKEKKMQAPNTVE